MGTRGDNPLISINVQTLEKAINLLPDPNDPDAPNKISIVVSNRLDDLNRAWAIPWTISRFNETSRTLALVFVKEKYVVNGREIYEWGLEK